MRRVLVPGGRCTLNVARSLLYNPYLRALAHFPPQAAFRYHRQPSENPALALEWLRFPDSSVLASVRPVTMKPAPVAIDVCVYNHEDIEALVDQQKLNRVIHRSGLTSRFISLFFGELESNGNLAYVNAGHPAPGSPGGQAGTADRESPPGWRQARPSRL